MEIEKLEIGKKYIYEDKIKTSVIVILKVEGINLAIFKDEYDGFYRLIRNGDSYFLNDLKEYSEEKVEEMTVSQVCELLGREIKIVKE